MPSFGSKESPSLKKMDYNNNNNARYGGGSKFSMGHIVGDPFSLATIGIALAGWLIAFVSSIIADVGGEYPNYSWWALAYMFCVIIGIIVATGFDAIHTYHVAIVGFLAAGMVFTTSSVNSLIYWSNGSKEAAAAGFILMSMVSIVWIFHFGSQPSASHRQTLDSFALHKDRAPSRNSRHMTQSYARPETTHSANLPPQMYNANQLAGFETSSPVTGYPGGALGANKRESAPNGAAFPHPAQQHPLPHQPMQQQSLAPILPTTSQSATAPSQQESAVSAPAEYPYRAKAIYSYEANPDDANEISFSKHEILEVSDVSGRWWQAKKENGETGIAPSNYLILL
ncbi:Transmembrane osmosensor [Friedmanniomyces endolithicus]|uniref:Transmembrane osmosensor n=1 Tax=Friedmanniomyces endolithicus TaxID=329885 RepID=A0AAN6J8P7_9PEZI|nr:Transmembrane osmosensor [Friedmanniomyces endolithicus]KAK0294854.1 Transmembrane osmosensor [Friedmanniomyces endolithicus]KAK0320962.1 Transmembrane osmosensor [Friedmanniomyces endolithicus]